MGVKVRQKPSNSGIWWIFVSHNGKRTSKRIGSDKKHAFEVAKTIESKLTLGDLGIIDKKKEATFGEYAKSYSETTLPASCKVSTKKNYEYIFEKHVLPEFENTKISDINRFKVKQYLLKLLNSGYSASTVNHIKCAISNVLNLAVDDEIIQANPAHRLGNFLFKSRQKEELNPDKKISPLTREELSTLLNVFKEHFSKDYPLVLTLARTGMRFGEVLGLQWNDIDFENRIIHIQRNYSKSRIDTPKSGKSRDVDMSLQLAETLRELKEKSRDNSEWIFLNNNQKPINGENWRKRIFHKATKLAKIKQIRIHDLRHTFASLLLQMGIPMIYVRDQLGHSSIRITVDTYGHLVPGGNKEAVDGLDD